MRTRTLVGAVTAFAACLAPLLSPTPASAYVPVEWNSAVDTEFRFQCYYEATQGDSWDPSYSACFQLNGDYFWARDSKRDGKAAVARWKFYPPEGRGYADRPSRQGVCVFTGGVAQVDGRCNKNLPETGAVQIWAGYRRGDVNRLDELVLGSMFCYYVSGDGGLRDQNCLLV